MTFEEIVVTYVWNNTRIIAMVLTFALVYGISAYISDEVKNNPLIRLLLAISIALLAPLMIPREFLIAFIGYVSVIILAFFFFMLIVGALGVKSEEVTKRFLKIRAGVWTIVLLISIAFFLSLGKTSFMYESIPSTHQKIVKTAGNVTEIIIETEEEGMKPNLKSIITNPSYLFRHPQIMSAVLFFVFLIGLMFLVSLPILEKKAEEELKRKEGK